MADAPYGYCPKCGAEGVSRERSPDGNTTCENYHTYLSRDALPENFPPLPRPDWRDATPVDWDKRGNRIEALRAASRIVAGISPVQVGVAKYTFDLAEQFAKWLETGER